MALNLFKKRDKQDQRKDVVKKEVETTEASDTPKHVEGNWSAGSSDVLRGFYVSEKAYSLNNLNQYVFKVPPRANKSEVSKQVEKVFNVKVKDVKVLNMPTKERNVGKHSGVKSGFKKAIVVLEEGQSIDQAK